MDFAIKPEVKELVGNEKVDTKIIETELAPALSQFEEPAIGPATHTGPEKDKAPDPSALAAWVDDLTEYGDAHMGEAKAAHLMDKIASGALDDVQGTARGHLRDDVDAELEQPQGVVNDFHADTALEGAAPAVPGTAERADELPLTAKARPHAIDDGAGGGGGGGGGGDAPPPGEPTEGEDDGDAAAASDDPAGKGKGKKPADADKAPGKGKDSGKPDPTKGPDSGKPKADDKKPDDKPDDKKSSWWRRSDKKRDGDR